MHIVYKSLFAGFNYKFSVAITQWCSVDDGP